METSISRRGESHGSVVGLMPMREGENAKRGERLWRTRCKIINIFVVCLCLRVPWEGQRRTCWIIDLWRLSNISVGET